MAKSKQDQEGYIFEGGLIDLITDGSTKNREQSLKAVDIK